MRATTKTYHGRPCKQCGTTERYVTNKNLVCRCIRAAQPQTLQTFQNIEDADDYRRITECELVGVFLKNDRVVGLCGKDIILNAFLKFLSAHNVAPQSTTQHEETSTITNTQCSAECNQSVTVGLLTPQPHDQTSTITVSSEK